MADIGDAGLLPPLSETQPILHQALPSVSPGVFSAHSGSYNKTENMFGQDLDESTTSPREALVEEPPASVHSWPAGPTPAQPSLMQPPTIDSIGFSKLTGARIFLDICCGVNSPLSTAIQNLQGEVQNSDDFLDSNWYEQLLRLCASGIVAYAGASPSCCEYSWLKLLPNGPPSIAYPRSHGWRSRHRS